jgi:catechol 2,3-dioxygenase-like lactoylglutathione lyase family enzyme
VIGAHSCSFTFDGEKHLGIAASRIIPWVNLQWRVESATAFLKILDEKGIPYSDYGTAFAKEWHQVFFQDPAGNIIEIHQQVV